MFLPEPEIDLARRGRLGRLLDITGCFDPKMSVNCTIIKSHEKGKEGKRRKRLTSSTRPTEIHAHRRPHIPLQPIEVRPIQYSIPHTLKEPLEVGASEIRPRLQLRQRIHVGAHTIQHDILRGIHVELLGEVGMDLQEFNPTASGQSRRFSRLLL